LTPRPWPTQKSPIVERCRTEQEKLDLLRLCVYLVLLAVASPVFAQELKSSGSRGAFKAASIVREASLAQQPFQLQGGLGARKSAAVIRTPAPKETSLSRRVSPDILALVDVHARNHGVPSALAHQVVMKESRYNPAARNRSYWGLMQIRYETARSVGYGGAASGLLDPDINLRYGMAYLGNAYRVADGDSRRALALYTKGFYFEAKRRGMLKQMRKGDGDAAPANP